MSDKKEGLKNITLKMRVKEVGIIIAGWFIPGMGHLLLKRYGRGLLIFLIINFLFFFGLFGLIGKLYATEPGNPISIFAAMGQKGVGAPYIVIKALANKQEKEETFNYFYVPKQRYSLKEGLPSSPYYEYGVTFTVSAGLLNLLILFDIFDIVRGRKK